MSTLQLHAEAGADLILRDARTHSASKDARERALDCVRAPQDEVGTKAAAFDQVIE
jgi:hypothetical protein